MRTLNKWVNQYIAIIVILFAVAIGYLIQRLNYGIETGTNQRTVQLKKQDSIKKTVERINAKIDRNIIDSLKQKIE
ncbi:uncharacterized membrane-anchored protein YhcB (DUF1043 family) [Chryseobacterium rhizosphaerae]|uniref:hypothetical protein n=1 Tax=Chryseobacterium rhizosphaerae TaxID=395937 RepID=UPI0028588068|nr:hypothetical protein [Chryseobacterium rhizosphaerae]MDR6548551.1 uncharacterized membrane-anchored protein YhcB (DUF1043 family) [Chryseobacterium rhizosphaerae]